MEVKANNDDYRPELDGLRALCIIFTIFNHVPGRPMWINGTVGVDVFFALSGWLITWLLLRESERSGTVELASFYIRRSFRIVPLYLLTVLLYVVLSLYGMKAGAEGELAKALPYMLTFNMEYRPEAAGNLFGHAWTLGIEEKFYLLWPMLVAMLRGRGLLVAWLGALLLSFALILLSGFSPLVLRGYLGLGFGASAAVLVTQRLGLKQRISERSWASVFFASMLVSYVLSIIFPQPLLWNVAISFCAAGAIASMWLKADQLPVRFLQVRPLPWLGTLTYAIYLIQSVVIRGSETIASRTHLPDRGWPLFVLTYLLCVVLAFGLHKAVELPLIERGRSVVRRRRERAK